MPCLGDRFPALPSNPMYHAIFYPSLFGPGEVITYVLPAGPVPTLNSNSMYLAILYVSLFGPGRGY